MLALFIGMKVGDSLHVSEISKAFLKHAGGGTDFVTGQDYAVKANRLALDGDFMELLPDGFAQLQGPLLHRLWCRTCRTFRGRFIAQQFRIEKRHDQ